MCYFLGKNDREPWAECLTIKRGIPSYGCNGFFVNREWFKYTDLDHYYPMDAHVDMQKAGLTYYQLNQGTVWHRTSDSLWSFMKKRYKYARDLLVKRKDRRWFVISGLKDYWRLLYFIFSVITVIPLVVASGRGYRKIKDPAWAWHWPVCACFLATYGVLTCTALLYRALEGLRRFTTARNRSTNKPIKTTKS